MNPRLAINRFTVMSILQAARAEAIGMDHDSALSWGLNRAIFYAAAKRGFKGQKKIGPRSEKAKRAEPEKGTFLLGDELAYTDQKEGKLYFTIGGETQTPEDFNRQIKSRFKSDSAFKKAWNEAKKIIKEYDENKLRSGRAFYEEIYKPRRDSLSERWNEMVSQ